MSATLGLCLLFVATTASAFFPNEGGNINWLAKDKTIYCMGDINFFDDNIGANVCYGYLYTTINGGLDWTHIKTFSSRARSGELSAKGVKLFSPSDIMVVGTYISVDQNKTVTNELVVTVSKDGGQTFSETLVEKYEGSRDLAGSLTFEGNIGVIGREQGSAYYFSKDKGTTWQKTVPPFERVAGKPSLNSNGLLRVLRLGPSLSPVHICSFYIGGSETWTCEKTTLSFSRVNSSQVIGSLSFQDEKNGFVALGMSESVFGGVYSNQLFGSMYFWSPSLKQPGSCYQISYLNAITLIASCIVLDVSPSEFKEKIVSFSSIDNGMTWKQEYSVDHPYPNLYKFLSHKMSNGKNRIFLSDYQRYSIGELL